MLGLNFCFFFVEQAKQQSKMTRVELRQIPYPNKHCNKQPTCLHQTIERKICQTWTIEEAKDYYEAKATRVFIFTGIQYTHAEESNV